MTSDTIEFRIKRDLETFNTALKDNPNNSIVKDRIAYDEAILRIIEDNKRLRKKINELKKAKETEQ